MMEEENCKDEIRTILRKLKEKIEHLKEEDFTPLPYLEPASSELSDVIIICEGKWDKFNINRFLALLGILERASEDKYLYSTVMGTDLSVIIKKRMAEQLGRALALINDGLKEVSK